MRISITSFMAAAVLLSPALVCAQANDAAYCKALSEKYVTYLANMTTGRSPQPDSVDGRVAMEQCKAGNPAAAIPVLEQKLRSAKIDLPSRG
jgi:hypothetical protein